MGEVVPDYSLVCSNDYISFQRCITCVVRKDQTKNRLILSGGFVFYKKEFTFSFGLVEEDRKTLTEFTDLCKDSRFVFQKTLFCFPIQARYLQISAPKTFYKLI